MGICRRKDPDSPDHGRRRSKRIKIDNQNAPEEESNRLTNCDRLDAESDELDTGMEDLDADTGEMDTDDDGYPIDQADSDAEDEASDADDENDDSDSEDDDSDSDDSEESKPPPNRHTLEGFRAYCRDLKGIGSFSKEQVTSITLLDALKRKKTALNAFPEILEWHLKETGHLTQLESLKDTPFYTHREPLLDDLHKRYNVEKLKPKIKKVRLPFSKAVVKIPYRKAAECISSLLTEPRIKDEDMLFHGDSPWGSPPETVTTISDLNTGSAFLKTHKHLIKKKNEVLVMVPFYIDGASTGQFCNQSVTPLKIGLGIHKRATREKEYAWRTIGWIPTIRKAKTKGKVMVKESMHMEGMDLVEEEGEGELDFEEPPAERDHEVEDLEEDEEEAREEVEESDEMLADSEEKAQDFHTMIHAILEASGFLDLQRTNMIFDLVYKGRCYRDSELVFVVCFVKCDTEEGDLLSGKFTARLSNVKHGCRYCHCPTLDLDNPLAKYRPKTQAEISKLVENGNLERLTAISQQNIHNAWHKVRFHQANEQGIHGATPSEKLHAILLGIFKYVRSTFFSFMGEKSQLAGDIDALGKAYGKYLTHQSEKDFPMTNFSHGLNDGLIMGVHYRGILLIMAAIFRSSKGRRLLERKKKFRDGKVDNWSYLVELLLGWEAFLCEDEMELAIVKRLGKKSRYIMYQICRVAHRIEGMGLKLMKFHAITHLSNDILLYGVPKEVDTAPNESHHKPSKQAAKNTQRNDSTFLYQVAKRLTEMLVIAYAIAEVEDFEQPWTYFDGTIDVYPDDEVPEIDGDEVVEPGGQVEETGLMDEEHADNHQDQEAAPLIRTGGTKIRIYEDANKAPSFEVLGTSKYRHKTKWIKSVYEFINDLQNLLKDDLPDKQLLVQTEHQRADIRWRAHPNYKGGGSWRDWVLVDWGPEGVLPAKIWCFLDLSNLKSTTTTVRYGGIDIKAGTFAVVECATYDTDPEVNARSDIFKPITVEIEGIETDNDGNKTVIRKFYLADCDAFSGACSVIPDFGGEANAYFMVQPRREWKQNFINWVKEPHSADTIDEEELADIKKVVENERRKKEEKRAKKKKKVDKETKAEDPPGSYSD